MLYMKQITQLSWFTAEKFALLTPLITVVMVVLLALGIALGEWIFGLSPLEAAFGFVEEATLPAVGATAKLGLVALCFAVATAFGHWCQSQAKLHLDPSLLSWVLHFLLLHLGSNLSLNPINRVLSAASTNYPLPCADQRPPVSTPADLAGATPLLI